MEPNPSTSQERFKRMLDWITLNGGCYDGIQVPVTFKSGEVGVAASKDLPPKTAIMCIPSKVILSVARSLDSQLKHIFKKYDEMFNIERVNDAEFNILAFFLFFELLKKDQSFYKPYFDCLPTQDFTMMDWPSKCVLATNSDYLKGQAEFVTSEMDRIYNAIKTQVIDNQEIFTRMHLSDQQLKTTFYKAYNIVMTRCYGWSLPSTCLIPLADMCNHRDTQTSTHYVAHKKYQLDPPSKPNEYFIKRQQLDLSILGIPPPQNPRYKHSSRYHFVNRYIKSKKAQEIIQVPPSTDEVTLSSMITAIENQQLCNSKSYSQLNMFYSSDSEDNDTDQEEKQKRKNIVADLKCKQIQINTQRRNRAKRVPEEGEGFQSNPNTQHIEHIHDPEAKDNNSEKSDSLEEESWDWLEKDRDWCFVVTTEGPIKKGDQIYNNYGERTNRFLMMWYGFCPEKNKYDSFSFRVQLENSDKWPLHQLPEHMIFTGWIQQQLHGQELLNQQLRNKHLSKQFRLKSSKLCLDFIKFLRMYLLKYYKNFDQIRCFQIPTSIEYEIFVFQFFLLILVHLLQKYFPRQANKQQPSNHFQAFVQNFRRSQECIVYEQRNVVRQCLNVLVNLKKGAPLKDFMNVIPIQNLKRILEYLKELEQFI